jgi:hypothetical protein
MTKPTDDLEERKLHLQEQELEEKKATRLLTERHVCALEESTAIAAKGLGIARDPQGANSEAHRRGLIVNHTISGDNIALVAVVGEHRPINYRHYQTPRSDGVEHVHLLEVPAGESAALIRCRVRSATSSRPGGWYVETIDSTFMVRWATPFLDRLLNSTKRAMRVGDVSRLEQQRSSLAARLGLPQQSDGRQQAAIAQAIDLMRFTEKTDVVGFFNLSGIGRAGLRVEDLKACYPVGVFPSAEVAIELGDELYKLPRRAWGELLPPVDDAEVRRRNAAAVALELRDEGLEA